MAAKKAIIHIGGHKTGSSAIQGFCVLNAARLEQNDILYPLQLVSFPERIGGQAHHCLVNLFMDATTFWKSWNLRPKGMTDEGIVNFLKNLPRDKNILLSSENLVWLDNKSIKDLKDLLKGFDTHVILYARRQDDAAQALYQTVVVSTGEVLTFKEYMNDFVLSVFAYDKIAENWQSVMGKGNVHVRAYERDQLYERDSVLDFFHVLEDVVQSKIDLSDWQRDNSTLNRGFPAHVTALLRQLNNNGFIFKKFIIPAIRVMTELLYTHSRGSYEIISPSDRQALLEKFANANQNLAVNFLGRKDGVLFHNLKINQTDTEWNEKYNQPGSFLKILIRDIGSQLMPQKTK